MIRAALESLDGQRRTLIILRNNDNANLVVGGGQSHEYVVYATFDNQSFQILARNLKSKSMVTVNAGGQVGEYPARWVVGIGDATQAALRFAADGVLDPSLTWETRNLFQINGGMSSGDAAGHQRAWVGAGSPRDLFRPVASPNPSTPALIRTSARNGERRWNSRSCS